MNSYRYIPFILLIASLLWSCEDIVEVNLRDSKPILAVDGVITNEVGEQRIRLTVSTSYFDTMPAPPAKGASVTVTDSEGKIYPFTDPDQDGYYVWTPTNGEAMGQIGKRYTLRIDYSGESFEATTEIKRVPPIDSLTYEFREEELGSPEGYYCILWARDLPGSGDTYWIKTFRNGRFINDPSVINVAYDASFSAGGNNDGLTFIVPIREAINFVDFDADEPEAPWAVNDSVQVEIHSIPEDMFDFLVLAQEQINNGGLFATPITNTRTNIRNTNPNSDEKAVGYFYGAAISRIGTRIVE